MDDKLSFIFCFEEIIRHSGVIHICPYEASSDEMSLCMRKPTICICENKGADQLRGNREADQRLCFRYPDSTIPLLPKSEIFKFLACFCNCTSRLVSDLVGNPNCWFCHAQAQISLVLVRKCELEYDIKHTFSSLNMHEHFVMYKNNKQIY